MSSARKRAAIQKANTEAERLRQRLILAEHHGAVMRSMAEAIAMRHDTLRAAVKQYLAENDPEGFGCACESDRVCGPCRAAERQKVLRVAMGSNAIGQGSAACGASGGLPG